jgi:ATP-dependent DNA ligase
VVIGPDGRPSFELLSARLRHGRRLRLAPTALATFVAFDILELDGQPVVDRPWAERRDLLVDLDWSGGSAIPTIVCDDGHALFAATDELGVEGVVAKRRHSRYLCGRRSQSWLKLKHRHTGWYDVAGWRLATRTSPGGGIVLAENGKPAGTALCCLPSVERAVLHDFVRRHGTAAGATIRLPAAAQVRVDYLETTPTGRLREAVARRLRPAVT